MSKIGSNMTDADWRNLRLKLFDKEKLQPEWDDAICFLKDRVLKRYFEPIELMTNIKEKSQGEGFSILTLECALIEFLAALVEGQVFKYGNTDSRPYFYSRSAKLYNKFLKTAGIFDDYFEGAQGTVLAQDFYLNVRCALIHEAQTRNGWTVNIYKKNRDLDQKNKMIFDGKSIYRTALFFALKQYFSNFCEKIAKEESKQGRRCRKYIARRIDWICEIRPDEKFWW